ncbi:MAG: hypothetical protein QXL15_03495 [Candidatus Korarchaeota archaeon]
MHNHKRMMFFMIICGSILAWGLAVAGSFRVEKVVESRIITNDFIMINEIGDYKVEVAVEQQANVTINNESIQLNQNSLVERIIGNGFVNVTVNGTALVTISKIELAQLWEFWHAIIVFFSILAIGWIIFSRMEKTLPPEESPPAVLNEVTKHTFDTGTSLRALGPGLSLILFAILVYIVYPSLSIERQMLAGNILVLSPFLILIFSYFLAHYLLPTQYDYRNLLSALKLVISKNTKIDLSGWKKHGMYIYRRNIEMVDNLIRRRELKAKLYGDVLVSQMPSTEDSR